MRLFKKSEINVLKEQERKAEIDQGLKLSRRVDVLRETVAQEEASLEAFRRSSIKVINDEIKDLAYRRDILKGEISTLEQERTLGMGGVEAREADVMKRREEVDKLIAELNDKLNTAFYQENQLAESLKNAQEDEQRTNTLRVRAELELENITKTREETESFQAAIQIKTNELALEYHQRELKVIASEETIAKREQAVITETARLEKLSEDLGNKERAINDKYIALLAAQS
jgi:chromosome segregation ATPase